MNLRLVNYRHASSQPFRSIMHLPRAEAFEMAARLYESSQCKAHRRFGPDFEAYYEYRLKIEAALYDEFIALGGKPDIKHPYYFVVESCASLCQNFDNGVKATLPLNDINPSDISFTFGDSMAQFESGNRRPMFLLDELYSHIERFNNDIQSFISDIESTYKCIEAQVWTDRYWRAQYGSVSDYN